MKKITLVFLLCITFLFADEIYIYSVDNASKKITPQTIEEGFKKNGFNISDNRDMNDPFVKQFEQTDFAIYNLFTVTNLNIAPSLLLKAPQAGSFMPQSMSIWTKKGETKLSIAFLSKEAISNILGIDKNTKELIDNEKQIKSILETVMKGGKYEKVAYKKASTDKPLISKYEVEMDEKFAEQKEQIQMIFDDGLKPNGFVQAGFTDINYQLKEKQVAGFDFFDVYSICKLKVIYYVAKSRPEAGAFAPCSLYMYKKTGDNKMHIGFPNVYNWMSLLNIKDEKSIFELEDAQKRMNEILKASIE